MVDPNHPRISIVRQCRLVSIACSSFYYAGPKAKTRRSHKSCRSLPPKTRRNPQQVAERLHAADPRWGRRINSTGPISDDTVAYRVGTSPQHRYRTRRPYHPRPAPVAHLRSLGGDAGGASHYIPAYLGISRHISDPFFCSRAPRRRRGAEYFGSKFWIDRGAARAGPTLQRVLNEMVAAGVLRRVGDGRGTRYARADADAAANGPPEL